MKSIILWHPFKPNAEPVRLHIDDAIASALVRSGVAAAANPLEAGSLSIGAPISSADPVEVVIASGASQRMRRVLIPAAVAALAVSANVAAYVSGRASAIIVPPTPSLSLSSAVTQAEGNSGTSAFVWTLTLNRDGSTASYPYSWAVTGSGTNPADAADFGGTFPGGSGTFAPGETSKTITVLVAGDTAVEPDDTFTLTVTAAGLNTVTSTGTISNDDTSSAASERIVSYGTSIPVLSGDASTNLQKCTRKLWIVGEDTPYLKGTFDNWRTEPGGDAPNTVNMTILQHAYMTLDGSKTAVATFDGGASTSKTLGTSASDGIRIPHDQVSAAALFGAPAVMIPRGTVLIMQTDTVLAAAGKQLYNCSVTTANSSSVEFPATGTPVAPGVGAIPAQTGQATSNNGYTASCVYGYHSSNAHINLGDSISADTGDNVSTAPRAGYSRAAQNMYGQNTVPMLNIARHGTSLSQIINDDNSIATTGLLRSAYIAAGTFTDLRENFAANDLGQTPAAGSATSVWDRKQRFFTAIVRARQPGAYITVVQPIPRVTNGTTNTPLNSGWARGGEADLLRQLQEQALTNGVINFVVRGNALRLSSDPTNDNYFVYKDIAYSLDGTHINPAGYQVVIPEHRVSVLRGNTAGDEVAYTAGQKILDTFTAGAGSSVKSRASDSGATWSGISTADMTVTAAGRAFFSANGYMFVSDPAMSRHQYLERDVDVVAAATPQQQVLLRASSTGTAFTGYTLSFNASTLLASISRVTNGTSSLLASVTIADPGASYTIRGEANGPNLKLSIGPKGAPVDVLSFVDGSYYTGLVGVRDTTNATATTGRQNDNVRAGNLAA